MRTTCDNPACHLQVLMSILRGKEREGEKAFFMTVKEKKTQSLLMIAVKN